MKINDTKTVAACAFTLMAASANAGIQMVDQPYREVQEIEFSIGDKPTVRTSAVVPIPVVPLEVWPIKKSSYLHETLRQWTARAGWTLVWGLGEHEDLRMEAGNDFRGDFKTVITDLFNSFPASVRINAELRPDNTPPLIFINRDDGAR
jgi:hypothetical protein